MKFDSEAICSIEQLQRYVHLSEPQQRQLRKVIERHPMRITPYYASLIDWNDPYDPIKKMALPQPTELSLSGSYDTSGEGENTKMPGLQHKYTQTVLILATNRCSLYCRHCFRKRLIGLSTDEVVKRFDEAVSYIKKHKEVNNVLISGGDPLILPTPVVERFIKSLSSITHLDFIRIGTRTPVTCPNRILRDKGLLRMFKKYSVRDRRIYIVTQYNHPREITDQSTEAVSRLLEHRLILSNQTVLLKGVNANPSVLARLQSKLVRIGVVPYYVFQCRPVKRVKHGFQETLYRGYHVVESAKQMLNGHAKRFKYVMSHRSGKIEIVGINGKDMYFRYHEAKDPRNAGKFFKRRYTKAAGWLDELPHPHLLSSIVQKSVRMLFPEDLA